MNLKSTLFLAGRHFCDLCPLSQVGSVNGKPFWIPIGDSFQKAYLEEWIRMGEPTTLQGADYKDCTTKQKRPEAAPSFGIEIVMAGKWRT